MTKALMAALVASISLFAATEVAACRVPNPVTFLFDEPPTDTPASALIVRVQFSSLPLLTLPRLGSPTSKGQIQQVLRGTNLPEVIDVLPAGNLCSELDRRKLSGVMVGYLVKDGNGAEVFQPLWTNDNLRDRSLQGR